VLLVPRDDDHRGDVSEHMAEHAQMLLQPDGPLVRRVVYRAARGDTVATLARRYRVAPAELAQWNQVATSTGFAAGQQVVIFVPSTTTKVARGSIRKRGSGAHAGKPGSKPAPKAVRSTSGNRSTSGAPAIKR
jgi:membrane-bound lytic murein transglycosylase D